MTVLAEPNQVTPLAAFPRRHITPTEPSRRDNATPNVPTIRVKLTLTDPAEDARTIEHATSWRVDDGVLTVHVLDPDGFAKHITVASHAWDYIERLAQTDTASETP